MPRSWRSARGASPTRDALPVLRAVDAFGFHLAALDIRQNSRFHDKALGQLMTLAGHPGEDFAEWDEAAGCMAFRGGTAFLAALRAPGRVRRSGGGRGALLLPVAGRACDTHGPGGLGALIVSMTRQLSDLLVVFCWRGRPGLAHHTPEGLVCRLPVTPLFETAEDLERAPGIMRAFLAHPVTQRSLRATAAGRNRCSR